MKKIDKKKSNKKERNAKDIINLDNEIIIGLTPKKTNKSNAKKKKTNKEHKKIKQNNKTRKNTKKTKRNKKEKTVKATVIKIIILIVLILLCVVLFMLSSVFNIKQIVVNNNTKVTTEEIITLSELQINENIFKTSNKKIKDKIKTNPYIEDVIIKKKLNGVIELNVKERVVTYIIRYADKYAYINNQGYILEISDVPIEVPELLGISTAEENIKPGNRLENSDLEKLDSVIKIIASAKSLQIDQLITSIDITNDEDYLLYLASELKIVHFGDESNKNDKMSWILEIVEQKKDEEGEIFVNDLEKRVFFRKKI